MTERDTRQLAAVYDVVSRAHDHPTADDIYARVRRHLPRVSLGTVYRNLQKLVAQRRIRPVHVAQHAMRYDGMLCDHDHFVCETCGTVIDLMRRRPRPQVRAGLARAGYAVRSHAVTLYGTCPQCAGEADE